ncbi:MAG TPA: hypothetical protein VIX42_00270 [Edaphobacter sp.]
MLVFAMGDLRDKQQQRQIQGSLHCGGFAAFGRDDVLFGTGDADVMAETKTKTEADPYGMTTKGQTTATTRTGICRFGFRLEFLVVVWLEV